jgi:biotin carboxylase
MKKRIIFFDANLSTLPAIKYAKSCGFHVVTCDNKAENPGHKEADESILISTYDLDAIDAYIEKNPVDGVVYFASAHGSYAGSHVIEKFHLPGITESIKDTLSYKDNFRQYLKNNGFSSYPKFILLKGNTIPANIDSLTFPVIVKPTDSGGNKGITKVSDIAKLQEAVNLAFEESRSGNVVIEEYIDGTLQINGDCIVENGVVKLAFLGRYLYPSCNKILPCATIFGNGVLSDDTLTQVKREIQRLVSSTGIKSAALNLEFRVSSSGKIYFIEVNTRHSGNFIYQMMNMAYGISLEEISVKLALGEALGITNESPNGYFAYTLFYSEKDGILDSIEISEELNKYIFKKIIFKKAGDTINKLTVLSDRIGVCLLKFPSFEKMTEITENFGNYYHINLK